MARLLPFIGPFAAACLLGFSATVHADKVIMKDGKIYEGRIMGETLRAVLLNSPREARPRFIPMRDILTIVRESRSDPPESSPGRFPILEAALLGAAFSSEHFSFDPAAGLRLAGGFRLHPSMEADAGVEWLPALFSPLTVQAGELRRRYQYFSSLRTGFWLKVFPAFAVRRIFFEPYLLGGFTWDRLTPQGSGDRLTGHTWQAGAGLAWPLGRALFLDGRFLYQRTAYGRIHFLGGDGDLSDVHLSAYTLSTGLSWRFL